MKHKPIKVLFVLKKRNLGYGPSFGLHCSCSMISQTLKKYGIESHIAEVLDNNFIERELVKDKYTHVFVEALWVVSSKIELLVKKYNKINFFVRLHSASPFIQGEGIAFQWLKEYWQIAQKYKNFHISCNDKRLKEELKLALGIRSVYSPNIYFHEKGPICPKKVDNFLDIACMGAVRSLKAILPQALAAMIYGNQTGQRIRFHINGNRLEGDKPEAILKNLISLFENTEHKLVLNDWMTHKMFIKFIQKHIDIGMCVSLSETYCLVAKDILMNDVPVVVSSEIKDVLPIFKADSRDYQSMVDALGAADSSRFTGLHLLNKILLQWGNYKATKEWLYLLNH